jgi:hypothetical protein
VNLLFFTVELERNGVTDRPPDQRSRSESQSRWRALRWVGLTTAVIICAAAAGCGGWVLAGGDPPVGAAADWLAVGNSALDGNTARARLEITSQPAGAAVFVDGRERGATPVSLDVSRATHTLVLRHAEAIDDQRQILVTNDSNVNVNMWRRRPDVVHLRPSYPGASISDAAAG